MENIEFKKNFPEQWALKTKERARAAAKKKVMNRRFKYVLVASENKAKENGYLPCLASESEIEASFTGMCHNRGCNADEKTLNHRLHMDHDHRTGKFRGWLCRECNLAAGAVGDSVKVANGLADYSRAALANVLVVLSSEDVCSDVGKPEISDEEKRAKKNEWQKEYYLNNKSSIIERQRLYKAGIYLPFEKRGGMASKANRDFKKNNPEEWKKKVIASYRASSKRTAERKRFCKVIWSSVSRARKFGYSPCVESESVVSSLFTGRCANPGCMVEESDMKRRLCMDHDHVTGKCRGWLCGRCNIVLGQLGDSPERIRGLADYLGGAS